jgi:hypothetical protein
MNIKINGIELSMSQVELAAFDVFLRQMTLERAKQIGEIELDISKQQEVCIQEILRIQHIREGIRTVNDQDVVDKLVAESFQIKVVCDRPSGKIHRKFAEELPAMIEKEIFRKVGVPVKDARQVCGIPITELGLYQVRVTHGQTQTVVKVWVVPAE